MEFYPPQGVIIWYNVRVPYKRDDMIMRNSVLGFVVKPLTFHNEKPDTMVRRVTFTRRTLFPCFSLRFLAAPTMRRGFEGAPLSFPCRSGSIRWGRCGWDGRARCPQRAITM